VKVVGSMTEIVFFSERSRVADLQLFYADSDPAFFLIADLYPDLDPEPGF
jgi:hypothetical protein